jgi:hypothetical protein
MVNPVPNRATRQAERFGVVRGGANNTEKRDRGAALEFVEYEMRSVGGEESEVGAGVDELIEGCGKIVGEVIEAGVGRGRTNTPRRREFAVIEQRALKLHHL